MAAPAPCSSVARGCTPPQQLGSQGLLRGAGTGEGPPDLPPKVRDPSPAPAHGHDTPSPAPHRHLPNCTDGQEPPVQDSRRGPAGHGVFASLAGLGRSLPAGGLKPGSLGGHALSTPCRPLSDSSTTGRHCRARASDSALVPPDGTCLPQAGGLLSGAQGLGGWRPQGWEQDLEPSR